MTTFSKIVKLSKHRNRKRKDPQQKRIQTRLDVERYLDHYLKD